MSQIHPRSIRFSRGTAPGDCALHRAQKNGSVGHAAELNYIVLPGAGFDPVSADFAGGPAVGAASYLDAHLA
jgi:hypothetical protein